MQSIGEVCECVWRGFRVGAAGFGMADLGVGWRRFEECDSVDLWRGRKARNATRFLVERRRDWLSTRHVAAVILAIPTVLPPNRVAFFESRPAGSLRSRIPRISTIQEPGESHSSDVCHYLSDGHPLTPYSPARARASRATIPFHTARPLCAARVPPGRRGRTGPAPPRAWSALTHRRR